MRIVSRVGQQSSTVVMVTRSVNSKDIIRRHRQYASYINYYIVPAIIKLRLIGLNVIQPVGHRAATFCIRLLLVD